MGFVGCSARARALALQVQAVPAAAEEAATKPATAKPPAAATGPRPYPALNLSALTATGACSVLTARPWELRVYHLSRSGQFYTRTPATST